MRRLGLPRPPGVELRAARIHVPALLPRLGRAPSHRSRRSRSSLRPLPPWQPVLVYRKRTVKSETRVILCLMRTRGNLTLRKDANRRTMWYFAHGNWQENLPKSSQHRRLVLESFPQASSTGMLKNFRVPVDSMAKVPPHRRRPWRHHFKSLLGSMWRVSAQDAPISGGVSNMCETSACFSGLN